MSNMSYCRFENTSKDLRDCMNAIQEDGDSCLEEASKYEVWALKNLLEYCKEIVMYEDNINQSVENWKEANNV